MLGVSRKVAQRTTVTHLAGPTSSSSYSSGTCRENPEKTLPPEVGVAGTEKVGRSSRAHRERY